MEDESGIEWESSAGADMFWKRESMMRFGEELLLGNGGGFVGGVEFLEKRLSCRLARLSMMGGSKPKTPSPTQNTHKTRGSAIANICKYVLYISIFIPSSTLTSPANASLKYLTSVDKYMQFRELNSQRCKLNVELFNRQRNSVPSHNSSRNRTYRGLHNACVARDPVPEGI